MSQRTAVRTHTFTESVIRDMTRVARRHGAINLAQGFPDFPAPGLLKDAACRAIRDDVNQYAITWGTPCLRTALAAKYAEWYGLEVDAEREITVTCGATEAMAAVMLAAIDPGEEVVILEPFYENYGPDAVLCDAAPVFVPLSPPGFRLDPDRLAAAITKRTRAIVVNTPNNPTGRVFDRDELDAVARICTAHDIIHAPCISLFASVSSAIGLKSGSSSISFRVSCLIIIHFHAASVPMSRSSRTFCSRSVHVCLGRRCSISGLNGTISSRNHSRRIRLWSCGLSWLCG